MSQSGRLRVTAGSLPPVVSIQFTGNTGIAVPAGGNLNIVTANTTVQFVGSGDTLIQDFGASNLIMGSAVSTAGIGNNVGVGQGALASLVAGGSSNVAVGVLAGTNISTGTGNVGISTSTLGLLTTGTDNVGIIALTSLLTGSGNVAIGRAGLSSSGVNYTSSESYNLLLCNEGVGAESNTIRIGTQGAGTGQQNRCFIAGITGVTTTNTNIVTLNTATGQLGSTASIAVANGGTGKTSTTINQILYSSANNVISEIVTANGGVLTTGATGIPSIDTTNFRVSATGVQVKGNNTNTAPPAGFIGEQIRALGTAVVLASGTPGNLCSIALTAGIWDISGIADFSSTAGQNFVILGISTNTASFTGTVTGDNKLTFTPSAATIEIALSIPSFRATLSANTTYFLVGQVALPSGTNSTSARISATRVG